MATNGKNLSDTDALAHSTAARARKWCRRWVCQDTVLNNGRCFLLKWVAEDTVNASNRNGNEYVRSSAKLHVCNFEGCGKVFLEAAALRKHSHVHGERQYVCHYENCGKRFVDSSKLKRHFLIHTGEKSFICPFEGCGKAFSLDFNRRSHMRTHTGENYHTCTYPNCGKRFAHENKLRAHIASQHEKFTILPIESDKREKKNGSSSTSNIIERPHICTHPGCGKRYIHEYKLNLHLKKEHGSPFDSNSEIFNKSMASMKTENMSTLQNNRKRDYSTSFEGTSAPVEGEIIGEVIEEVVEEVEEEVEEEEEGEERGESDEESDDDNASEESMDE